MWFCGLSSRIIFDNTHLYISKILHLLRAVLQQFIICKYVREKHTFYNIMVHGNMNNKHEILGKEYGKTIRSEATPVMGKTDFCCRLQL